MSWRPRRRLLRATVIRSERHRVVALAALGERAAAGGAHR